MPTQSGSAATRRAVSSTMPMSRGSMPASNSRLNPAPTTAPIPASEENVKGANRSHAQSSRAISVAGRSTVGAEADARSSSTCRRCSASAVLTASRSTWAERSRPERPARRADPHDAQPEDPVQRGRREVDGADAVAGHRAALAAQPAGAQLDAVAGDPVAGGPPAQHAGEHHDRGTADGHPDLDEITGTAREQNDDGEREQLQQVLERPDHEHARVEAPPHVVDREVSITSRRPAWRGWSR